MAAASVHTFCISSEIQGPRVNNLRWVGESPACGFGDLQTITTSEWTVPLQSEHHVWILDLVISDTNTTRLH